MRTQVQQHMVPALLCQGAARIVIAVLALASFAQSQGAHTDNPQDELRIRNDVVKGYVVAVGIDSSALEAANLRKLREALDTWVNGSSPEAASAKTTQDQNRGAQGADTKVSSISVKTLYPNSWWRWSTVPQFKMELVEQPDKVLVQGNEVTNPQHSLQKWSIVWNFKQAVLLPADLATIYSSYGDHYKNHEGSPPMDAKGAPCLRAGPNALSCLRLADTSGILKRALAGVTATLSRSQNPQFQSTSGGIILPTEGPTEHLWSGEVDFDPTTLFPNGSDWGSVAKSVKGLTAAISVNPAETGAETTPPGATPAAKTAPGKTPPRKTTRADLVGPCTAGIECFTDLLHHDTWYWLGAGLLPTVSYKVNTNFDFVKAAGISPLVANQNHLWDVTFTVDMRRAVETLKTRTDALTYAESLWGEGKQPKVNPECKIQGLPHAIVGELYLYPLDSADTKRTWKLEDQSFHPGDQDGICAPQKDPVSSLRQKECMVNGFTVKSDGTLMGYPVAAGVTAIRAQVTYPDGEKGECRFDVDVERSDSKQKQARARFAMQVLEAAISPEIVLDDRWFRAFGDGAQAVLFPEAHHTTAAYTPVSTNTNGRK
jgi:hypothetical protein